MHNSFQPRKGDLKKKKKRSQKSSYRIRRIKYQRLQRGHWERFLQMDHLPIRKGLLWPLREQQIVWAKATLSWGKNRDEKVEIANILWCFSRSMILKRKKKGDRLA